MPAAVALRKSLGCLVAMLSLTAPAWMQLEVC